MGKNNSTIQPLLSLSILVFRVIISLQVYVGILQMYHHHICRYLTRSKIFTVARIQKGEGDYLPIWILSTCSSLFICILILANHSCCRRKQMTIELHVEKVYCSHSFNSKIYNKMYLKNTQMILLVCSTIFITTEHFWQQRKNREFKYFSDT